MRVKLVPLSGVDLLGHVRVSLSFSSFVALLQDEADSDTAILFIGGGCGSHFFHPERFLEFLVNVPKAYLEIMPNGSLSSESSLHQLALNGGYRWPWQKRMNRYG